MLRGVAHYAQNEDETAGVEDGSDVSKVHVNGFALSLKMKICFEEPGHDIQKLGFVRIDASGTFSFNCTGYGDKKG